MRGCSQKELREPESAERRHFIHRETVLVLTDAIYFEAQRQRVFGKYPTLLDGAVHGADISVDEERTVAAAATGLGFEEHPSRSSRSAPTGRSST